MAATASISNESKLADLRGKVDQFVGLFFYGTLLKTAREHKLTESKYGFGGRGEDVFGSQLDEQLAERAGRASHNGLSEAIFRQLSGKTVRSDAVRRSGAAPSGLAGRSPGEPPDGGTTNAGGTAADPVAALQSGANASAAAVGLSARRYAPPRPAGQKLDVSH